MLTESTRQFDLYDFFGVLIPGAVFILALFPFLPHDASVFTTGVLVATVAVGFVFGRALHALSLIIDQRYGATSHRDTFVNEVLEPESVTKGLANAFYKNAIETFPTLSLPDDRSNLERSEHWWVLEDLYGLVRSYIHMDARGRSRTFQAVFDFYRCMLTACFLLFAIYTMYTVALFFEIAADGWIGYNSYIGTLDLAPGLVFFGAAFLFLGPFAAFRHVRSDYREYYVQYLMSDFVVLEGDSGETSDN